MKTPTRTGLAVITILIIVAAAAIVQAGEGRGYRGKAGRAGHGMHDGRGHGGQIAMALKHLDLSDDQREKIEALREKTREENLEARKSLVRLKNELHGVMLEDSPDAAEAGRLIERIGDLRTRMRIERMETRLAIRNLLTPEQRDRLIAHLGRGGYGMGPNGFAPRCDGDGPHGRKSRVGRTGWNQRVFQDDED